MIKRFPILFFLMALSISCVSLKPPFYFTKKQLDQSNIWDIKIKRIGFLGPVNGNWWGDRYFGAEITVTNKSDKFRTFGIVEYVKEGHNIHNLVKDNPYLQNAYNNNPNSFHMEPDGTYFPGIDFLLEPSVDARLPINTYQGKLVFPVKKMDNKILISALLVGGNYGIPMGGPHTRSQNGTGFIAPGDSKTITAIFSIPDGFKPYKIMYRGIFETSLEEKLVE
ncbi:hypothetical protein EHQ81_10975 [Leptospira selangorensis]|uniref:DUF4352 domain-containing protein n=1 Tax=Leptospira selangorensis TaxID=2484982 RepID=A0A4R9GF47_9LEPT|nr:hypothetical protein [Leptospira selangorensis]TGK10495.1 hypothetical protein EHO58_00500 [Leptospira selangorensis]TGM13352.1 hypothetical protein EHQ81_10975 [Leptospira selangorensis]TGM22307.1 hypothetical protein EHQ82_07750 [Leptospira selangorensis]